MRRRKGFALLDVIIAGVILAIGLSTIFSITARSLRLQQQGEIEVIAAHLLDNLLGSVLTEGPMDYPKLHSTSGRFDAPFTDFEYRVRIVDRGEGAAFEVTAEIFHDSGRQYACDTLIAPKLGEEPDPIRAPLEPLDRQTRYEELYDL